MFRPILFSVRVYSKEILPFLLHHSAWMDLMGSQGNVTLWLSLTNSLHLLRWRDSLPPSCSFSQLCGLGLAVQLVKLFTEPIFSLSWQKAQSLFLR